MKKWVYNMLIILFVAVFLISAGYLGYYYLQSYQQAKSYDSLAELRTADTPTPRPAIGQGDPDTEIPPAQLVEVTDPKTGQPVLLLPEFVQLYTMNNDMVGWLSIPGVAIDYPVMQTPDRIDYYLKRNFQKQSSKHGCLYAREACDVVTPSDNVTIYGHHMRDGSMFGKLEDYTQLSFYEAHPYIYFDTLTALHTYQILAVFTTTATEGEGFAYHTFVNAAHQAEFDAFVDTCKELAFYDTGVDAQWGDKLITLSTCEYSQTNGRLVVVAKRIA